MTRLLWYSLTYHNPVKWIFLPNVDGQTVILPSIKSIILNLKNIVLIHVTIYSLKNHISWQVNQTWSSYFHFALWWSMHSVNIINKICQQWSAFGMFLECDVLEVILKIYNLFPFNVWPLFYKIILQFLTRNCFDWHKIILMLNNCKLKGS